MNMCVKELVFAKRKALLKQRNWLILVAVKREKGVSTVRD